MFTRLGGIPGAHRSADSGSGGVSGRLLGGLLGGLCLGRKGVWDRGGHLCQAPLVLFRRGIRLRHRRDGEGGAGAALKAVAKAGGAVRV